MADLAVLGFTAEELAKALNPAGATGRNIDQVLAHPHTAHRGMLVEIEDYSGIGAPIKIAAAK